MFNPNDNKYNKVYPTYDRILEEVSDYEIYRYYIGEFTIGKPFNSPLSKDTNPSFGIFPSRKDLGRLFFKDHRGPTGNVISFVKELYHLSTYKEALERVVVDFELTDKFEIHNNNLKQLKPITYRLDKESRKSFIASKLDLGITSRKWEEHDINYWASFGISKATLELFNVIPISFYWMGDYPLRADKYAYAYKEYKDGVVNYKIYQPFRDTRDHKFVNGFLDGTFSGWDLLPRHKVDLILITKSMKDVMFLYEHGYYAISPQGEGYNFKPQVIEVLKTKANRILTLYDHDNAGIKSAIRNRKEFGFEFITTLDFNNKDTTDYYRRFGLTQTLELLEILFK